MSCAKGAWEAGAGSGSDGFLELGSRATAAATKLICREGAKERRRLRQKEREEKGRELKKDREEERER